MSFRALMLEEQDGGLLVHIVDLDDTALFIPETLANEVTAGDVLIRVDWSAINYKDGLVITGKGPVVRKWPVVADIDSAGVVLDSSHPDWRTGDAVVLNGWGIGETHWGCLTQQARLSGDWLVALPAGLDARQAMAVGTAGYTTMLSVLALERAGVRPDDGEVLVTGASGGVGSIATALLGKLGYRMVASTGKTSETDSLQASGVKEVIDCTELFAPGKPLQKERWTVVVDSVGLHTLVNACAQMRYGGVVTACGLVQGMDFLTMVAPFILRGVTLYGINSVMALRVLHKTAWQCLAADPLPDRLAAIMHEVTLSEAIDTAHDIMAGKVRGRVVVDVNRQAGKPVCGRFAFGSMGRQRYNIRHEADPLHHRPRRTQGTRSHRHRHD